MTSKVWGDADQGVGRIGPGPVNAPKPKPPFDLLAPSNVPGGRSILDLVVLQTIVQSAESKRTVAGLAARLGKDVELIGLVIDGLMLAGEIEVVPGPGKVRRKSGRFWAQDPALKYRIYMDPEDRAEQLEKAQRLDRELTIVCEECKARPLDRCRTAAGKHATESHASRRNHANAIEVAEGDTPEVAE